MINDEEQKKENNNEITGQIDKLAKSKSKKSKKPKVSKQDKLPKQKVLSEEVQSKEEEIKDTVELLLDKPDSEIDLSDIPESDEAFWENGEVKSNVYSEKTSPDKPVPPTPPKKKSKKKNDKFDLIRWRREGRW